MYLLFARIRQIFIFLMKTFAISLEMRSAVQLRNIVVPYYDNNLHLKKRCNKLSIIKQNGLQFNRVIKDFMQSDCLPIPLSEISIKMY